MSAKCHVSGFLKCIGNPPVPGFEGSKPADKGDFSAGLLRDLLPDGRGVVDLVVQMGVSVS